MRKTKIKQLLFVLLMPVISFLLIGIFSFVNLAGNVFADKNGGGFFVGGNTTFNFNATISGSSATNGGGVYIANGGTFNMNGGAIYGNSATTTGNNIYNAGTFTMTGGRVGTSGSSSSGYGIYNTDTGTMNLYGGNVYDNVYSSANINTKMACNIAGTITLGDNATITLQDYAGTTPNYAINLSNTRTAGTILTFVGSSTEPDLTKLNISGYDTNAFEIVSEKNSSGNWTVILQEPVEEYDFPSDWKTQVASATYMTTTITPANLTGIQFVKNVPTGFTQIGTLSTGLPVYQGTTSTEIAFVGETIYAPENSASLFASLKKMTLLNTSSYNTSKVTTFNSMFMSCSALTDLDLSGFNTSKVTNMYRMFSGCRALVSLDLENFDTSNVTTMSTMFNVCESLVTLDLSMFNTPKVTTYYYMFSNCSKLETIDVSNFNTSNATNMGSMFTNCKSLKTLDLSSFNMVKVTTYSNMFNFGSSNYITLLKTPYNNKNELPITTGSVLFNAKTGDSVVSVPANTSESLTYTNESQNKYFPAVWKDEIASTTYMTTTITPSNLTSIQFVSSVPSDFTQIGTLSTGIKVYQSSNTKIAFVNSKTIYAPNDCSSLFDSLRSVTSIIFDNFSTSEVTNMKSMFYNCDNLKNLNLSGFDTTNVQDMSVMFNDCSGLASLNVSNFDTTNVTYMGYMFAGCSRLTSLDLSNFDTSKVTDMAYMFHTCSSLTSIDVSNFDTSKVTYMSAMFAFCSSLTSLDLSKFNTTNVTSMYSMFRNCSRLTSLVVSNFDTTNVTNMSYMFSYCTGLTSLDIGNFDTSKVTDMSYMFKFCSKLTSLDLSNFNTAKVTNMSNMFYYCSSLTSLVVSNFDTSKVVNMSNMFAGCSSLTSLNLSSFNMSKVTSYSNMFDFGSTGKLKMLKTPYKNTSALSIRTGSTLYNVKTGEAVTSVPANTTASKTYATQLTLTFDANGGTCNTSSATAYYNVSLRDSGFVFPYPTKSGYMFSGWYQNTSFVGAKLSLDSVFTTNCKFYAKWEDQNPPSGGGSSNSTHYIGWEETGRPLVNEVSEDIKRYNNNYTLESIDGFVIISEYNSSSFQDYTLVERLNISHLPVQIYIVELNPEGPNASYINCSNCSLIVAIYVQEFAFGISNTWDGVIFDENEQLFRELAPNAIFWDLRGFCTENFKPNDQVDGPTTEQYKLILGRQVQLCILPENFYLGIDWSLSEAGCVVQNYLFEDVTGDYSFVSSKNNDQNEIYRDIGIAKFSLNFNQERTIQNILNLNDEKLLETKRKIKLVSNVKKE